MAVRQVVSIEKLAKILKTVFKNGFASQDGMGMELRRLIRWMELFKNCQHVTQMCNKKY